MIKKLLLILITFSISEMSFAGFNSTPGDSLNYTPKMYVGVHAGSFGAGLQFAYPISKLITIRATGSYFPTYNKTILGTEDGANVTTVASFKSGGVGIIGDFSFFKNKPGIRFSTGLIYNITQATATRSYYLASDNFDLGNLTLDFTPKNKVSPYLGFVFGNLKTSKRVFFSMETGILYQGKPQLVFTGVGHISPTANESNTAIIENNVKSYQFYPYINLQLNFKL